MVNKHFKKEEITKSEKKYFKDICELLSENNGKPFLKYDITPFLLDDLIYSKTKIKLDPILHPGLIEQFIENKLVSK